MTDRRVAEAADVPVGTVATAAVCVPHDSTVAELEARFRADTDLARVVVTGGASPALHLREAFLAAVAGQLGRVRQPLRIVGEVPPQETVVLPWHTTVARAASAVISRSPRLPPLELVVVEWPDGACGVLAVPDLFEGLALHFARQSLHDPLTGLANRTHLEERLRTARTRGQQVTLHFIDLDRFKDVNDQLGHAVGDEVLRQLAARLRALSADGELVARLAGDEFALLTVGAADGRRCREAAESIVAAAGEPFGVEVDEADGGTRPETVVVGASVGVATAAGTGIRPEVLLKHADLAMYRAKSRGRGRYELFDPEMLEDVEIAADRSTRRAVERRLREVLAPLASGHGASTELDVHYQPVVELPSGRVAGAEALIRWTDPVLGRVAPDDFIPIAEASGLVVDLGRWVLRTACREAVGWTRAGEAAAPWVAVNVSAVQLAQRGFVGDVTAALAETGLAPHRLHLEITETAGIADLAVTATRLARLRGLGVALSLDDFGTGHSSLTLLRALPVQQVKIDRSFVAGVTERAGDAVLVRLVVEAAHGLGMQVCAEGVERTEQAEQLVAMGCDLAQGWLFGRPEAASPALRTRLAQPWGTPVDQLQVSGWVHSLGVAAAELVLVTDSAGVITYASAGCLGVLGVSPRELLGTRASEHRTTEQPSPADGWPSGAVHRVRHRDGSHRWLETTSRQLGDGRAAPAEWLTVARDVTGVLEAQRALAASEQQLRLAFDEAPTGMAITRLDGTFERVNQALAVLLGRTAAELGGLTVQAVTHPADRAVDRENAEQLRLGRQRAQDVAKRYLHADGHALPVWVRVQVLDVLPGGTPTRVIAHVTPR